MTTNESTNNICPVCGGVLHVTYTITFEQCLPKAMEHSPMPDNWHFCPGHTELQGKHGGNLDNYALEDDHAEVWLESQAWMGEKQGIGLHVHGTKRDTYLDAKQALSLYKWLGQKRPVLEELAKEQEGE